MNKPISPATVTIDGNTYTAKRKDERVNGGIIHRTCADCVFASMRMRSDRNYCAEVPCSASEREDHQSVIFV